jgi:1-acyl-sn-glycerol-3-phosphate acyltransferase
MVLLLRSLAVWIYGTFSMVVLSIISLIVAIFDKSGDGSHICARLWGRGILAVAGIKVEIKGAEHLDPVRPQVLATNHQGTFDIFVFLTNFPVQFRWVAKKSLFKIPFMGMAMRRAGYISIDRENSRQALKDLKEAGEKLKTGRSVVIFHEGTRSKTGKVGPFKRGSLLPGIDKGDGFHLEKKELFNSFRPRAGDYSPPHRNLQSFLQRAKRAGQQSSLYHRCRPGTALIFYPSKDFSARNNQGLSPK